MIFAVMFLFPIASKAATINIVDDIHTYASLSGDTVNMSGVSELHVTSATTPISGCTINLNSVDSFFFLENIKPSVAASTYLSQVKVSDANAVLGTNVRVVEYAVGAVIIPQSSTFQPLQVFTKENFQGNSAYLSQYTAYNTSSLGAMTSSISSFILKRGYTATFAQTEYGTGYSKNYVAQDCDLEIGVLPTKLNNQINFIRIFPWRWTGKKGIAGNIGSNLNIKWWYNWNIDQYSTLDKEYVPIRQVRWWPGLGQDWRARGASHLLGYNEPDSASQANIAVGDAIWSWPDLLGTGLRVGSPATTDGGWNSWLYPFMDQADVADLRVDFVAVHYYKCWNPADPSGAATQMYNYLKGIHDRTGRPIWITEWNNGANWTGCGDPTYAQQAAAIGAMIDMLDSTPWVERYAIYNWVEDVRRVEWDDGSPTDAGFVYRDQVSPIGYRQEVPGSGKSANAIYSFNTNFRDSSGNGNNPLFYGAPKLVTGRIGNALALDGADDYLVLPTNMGQRTDFTFAAWVFWNGGGQWQRIFDFGNDTTKYLFLTPGSYSNTLRFAVTTSGSGNEQRVETTGLAVGKWVHVAVTLSGNIGTLYVNGSPEATNTSMTINPSDFDPANNYIGKSQFSADPLFSGMIDEVYVADHVLSGPQIAGLMNNTLPLPPTDLTAGTASDGVNLSWVQSASSGITANKIYRSSNGSAGPYTLLGNISPGTLYKDATALYDCTYLYAVTAVNSSGEESVFSACESGTYPRPVLSQCQPVTASSYEAGNTPENGNDGSQSTRWTAVNSTYPQGWRVDMGSIQPLGKVVINWYRGTGRSYKYRIETSNDDVNYTTVVDQTGRTATGTSKDVLTAPARYVRITVTGVEPVGGWASFWECQIFGEEILVPNFGFETPTTTSYIYNPPGGSWTFSGSSPNGSGVTTNNSVFTSSNAVAPEGTQVAFLKGISSITQSLSGFVPDAMYMISFEASQRQNWDGQLRQTFDIKIDGIVIDSFEPPQAISSYQRCATAFTAGNANHTLAFVGTNLNGGDNTVFIDDVSIIQIKHIQTRIADLNYDGRIDNKDYCILANDFSEEESPVDIAPQPVSDGKVDFKDLALFLEYWLTATTIPPLPAQAGSPDPPNHAAGIAPDANLSWTAGSSAISHDVYIGTSNPPPFISNVSVTTFVPGWLPYQTNLYWRIDEINGWGRTTGKVWEFTTMMSPPPSPGQATNPNPADGATGVSIDQELSWTPGSGAISHDVYFGTSMILPFIMNQMTATFDPGIMELSTKYYWRINEQTASGSIPGPLWSFTTKTTPPPPPPPP